MKDKKDIESMFDGIELDVKIKGNLVIDVVIDNILFKELPADVQKEIIKQGVKE